MRIRLLCHTLEDEQGLGAVELLTAPREKNGTKYWTPLLQPLVEHLPVLLLDGKELLHMPALPEDMHKPALVILHDVDGEEFTDTEPGH